MNKIVGHTLKVGAHKKDRQGRQGNGGKKSIALKEDIHSNESERLQKRNSYKPGILPRMGHHFFFGNQNNPRMELYLMRTLESFEAARRSARYAAIDRSDRNSETSIGSGISTENSCSIIAWR
jgi:hypothetical protein